MKRFLNVTQKHMDLIMDLCAQEDVLSRPRLLEIMERRRIPAGEKDAVIRELCGAFIMRDESDILYTVNPAVINLVNYYERRGRLTHAGFLRDQARHMGRLADALQKELCRDDISIRNLSDTVDSLSLLVGEVREAGAGHYMACMRRFGDMKRSGEKKTLEERLGELEVVQRRYINPLRELIDPGDEYGRKISSLKRSIWDLSARADLLARSRELDQCCRRIRMDLQYIDHVLLRNFGTVADTARTLLKSLIEEKNIKDAVAACLGNLEEVWGHMEGKTVMAIGSRSIQYPGEDKIEGFFTEVLLKKLLPVPRPLVRNDFVKENASLLVISDSMLYESVPGQESLESWPAFVLETFGEYPEAEQLRAMTLPMSAPPGEFRIIRGERGFTHNFKSFTVRMRDFGLALEEET